MSTTSFCPSNDEMINPELIIIDGRYYRKNSTLPTQRAKHENLAINDFTQSESKLRPSMAVLDEDFLYDDYCEESEYPTRIKCEKITVEKKSGGGELYVLNAHIPDMFRKFIIGPKGETLKSMQHDTECQIQVPRESQSGPIRISSATTGGGEAAVLRAARRLELIVQSNRHKLPATHFFAIPIKSENVQKRFDEFRESVLNPSSSSSTVCCLGDRNLSAAIFRPTASLHLTLAMSLCCDQSEVARALQCLRAFAERNLVGEEGLLSRRLMIQFEGLEIMNDDPSAVRVVYAKLAESPERDRLQLLAQRLVEHLRAEGVAMEEYNDGGASKRPIKLHLTLINCKNIVDSVDASNLLRHFQSFAFGVEVVDEIHLLQRFSKNSVTGAYTSSGHVSFNK